MAKTANTTQFTDFQNFFDQGALRDGMKTFAGYGGRLSEIAFGTAAKSSDIMTGATHETISNLRGVTTLRDEPADYAKAYGAFAQSQFEVARRTAEALFGLAQQAGTDATGVVSDAGEEFAESATANADKAASKAKKAA